MGKRIQRPVTNIFAAAPIPYRVAEYTVKLIMKIQYAT
jgi:hypothetical protein